MVQDERYKNLLVNLSEESKIPFALTDLNFDLIHQPLGKTTDTFLVLVRNDSQEHKFISKFFKSWHKREVKIYNEYLTETDLNTPEFYYGDDDVLIIEYLHEYKVIDESTRNIRNKLFDWQVRKYRYFLNKLKDKQVDFDEHMVWMLKNPMQNFKKHSDLYDLEATLKIEDKLISEFLSLKNSSLLCILDHNDLENQNILFNGKEIKIIDWANSVHSLGMFDIAQFFKIYNEIGVFNKNYVQQFKVLTAIDNIEELIMLFQLIKEIMLLNYWLETDITASEINSSLLRLHKLAQAFRVCQQ